MTCYAENDVHDEDRADADGDGFRDADDEHRQCDGCDGEDEQDDDLHDYQQHDNHDGTEILCSKSALRLSLVQNYSDHGFWQAI